MQDLIEIEEHVNSAFQRAMKEGPPREKNMHSIRFNIMDVILHADAIHRGNEHAGARSEGPHGLEDADAG